MTRNPILEELYAAREQLLADARGDVRTFLQGVREREAASGRFSKAMPQSVPDRSDAAHDSISREQSSPTEASLVDADIAV